MVAINVAEIVAVAITATDIIEYALHVQNALVGMAVMSSEYNRQRHMDGDGYRMDEMRYRLYRVAAAVSDDVTPRI